MLRRTSKKRASGKRSGFEDNIEIALDEHEISFDYEKVKLPYNVQHNYTPDFRILRSGVLIEAKGWLSPEDRSKLAYVKAQHPDRDIRVLFEKRAEANRPIRPGSMTTNADWLQAHGIPWAAEAIPQEWTLERNPSATAQGTAGDPSFEDPRTWADPIPILTATQRKKRDTTPAPAAGLPRPCKDTLRPPAASPKLAAPAVKRRAPSGCAS